MIRAARQAWVSIALAAVTPIPASAQPPVVPIEGFLADEDGAPVDGSVSVTLRLYGAAEGGTALYAQTQTVDVERGHLILYAGSTAALELALFASGEVYLGIQIDDEAEMAPRMALGTVPYAAYAGYAMDADTVGGLAAAELRRTTDTYPWTSLTDVPADIADGDDATAWSAGAGLALSGGALSASDAALTSVMTGVVYDTEAELRAVLDGVYAPRGAGVPPGMIAYFPGPACPVGWSEDAAARGRVLVGLPSGGTAGLTVGAALSDLELPTHDHVFALPDMTTSAGGDHSHGVVFPPAMTSSDGAHRHRWAVYRPDADWWSWTSSGAFTRVTDWTNGMDSAGSGNYPLAIAGTTSIDRTFYTTDVGDHAHAVDWTTRPPMPTSISGAHTHTTTACTTTSAASTHVLPYQQLLVCRKD